MSEAKKQKAHAPEFNPKNPLGTLEGEKPFVVSLSNHEWPFDRLRANGFEANGLSGFKAKAGLEALRDMNATNDSGQEYGGIPRKLNCPPKAAAGRIA